MPTTSRYPRIAAALFAATVAILATGVPAHADTTTQDRPGLHRVTMAELRAMASQDATTAAVQWIYIMNQNSGLMLAVSGSSDANGAPIIQWPIRRGNQEQAWTFYWDSAGYLVLRNAGTSSWKAVGISASNKANGAKAIQWDYRTGLQDQEWILGDYGDATYDFENRNSLRCLAIPGGSRTQGVQAIQWNCNGGAEQRWELYAWP